MRAVIVDDEYYALQGLKMELEDIGGIEIVGMYEDGSALLSDLESLRADVIFLDIEMPQMDGFQIFEKVLESKSVPHIVFVTAFSHYAVKAFEINAIDYIVKPVDKNRLKKTIDRLRTLSASKSEKKLSINCFRHLSIYVDGKDINSGWRTKKAEELIAFLLCEEGKFISKEKIAEALWPDQNRNYSLSNLYMAYYYIKKQEEKMGLKIPIESERGKMRIDLSNIDCDMVEFNKLIDLGVQSGLAERVDLFEKAAELYRGVAFEDGYYPWASTVQGYYEYRYIQILNFLIEIYKKKGNEQKRAYIENKLSEIS